MSSLNDLVNVTTSKDSGSKITWNKFPAKGHTSQVVLVSDLEGNPRNLPELQVVKKYTVKPDYLSEKERQFAGPNRGRTIYYVDGDPLHPGHVKWWSKEKGVDDEDVIRDYIRQYGMIAYVFNINAYFAVKKVEEQGLKGLTDSEKKYVAEYGDKKGSGNVGEDESFNGILTYELHAGFASQVEAFYKAVYESGRTDWISNYIWDVTRPSEEGNYSVSKNIKISKIDEEDVAANPLLDIDVIEEAFAKAASEELALPSLWDTVVARKRFTPSPDDEKSPLGQYPFKDQPGAATAESNAEEPVHITTGRGEPVNASAEGVSDEDFEDDKW